MSVVDNLSIGYAPYSSDFSAPGDKRRFVYLLIAGQLILKLPNQRMNTT